MKLDGFKLFLLRKGLRQSTIANRIWWIARLHSEIGEITQESVEQYILELIQQGKSGGYINTMIMAVRLYAQFTNRDTLHKFLRVETKEKGILSEKQALELFKLAPARPQHARNHHMMTSFFEILYFTGMRPNELASMTVDNVDFGRGVFVVTSKNSKTKDSRLVPIPPNLTQKIQELVYKSEDLLFKTLQGNKLNPCSWKAVWDARIKRLGFKQKNLTVNSLRHTFITSMLNEDVDLIKVQRIVGQKRVETTAKYRKLVYKDLKAAILKHPLIKKARNFDEKAQALKEVAEEILGQDAYINVTHSKGRLVIDIKKKTA